MRGTYPRHVTDWTGPDYARYRYQQAEAAFMARAMQHTMKEEERAIMGEFTDRLRYFDCPVRGLMATFWRPDNVWVGGIGSVAQELTADEYYSRTFAKQKAQNAQKEQTSMNTKPCEACKGAGYVPDPLQVGDIVEVSNAVNTAWAGLGVVTRRWETDTTILAISGKMKGVKGCFKTERLTPRHGHIHLDR